MIRHPPIIAPIRAQRQAPLTERLRPYAVFSRIRGEFFPKDPPTSTAVQVAGLLLNAKIEIDAVAFLPASPAG
ncbi:MAG: RidA family protein [Stellaceae bacterium]